MTWRVAKALDTLRAQVNAKYPNRSKVSDGTIGDTAHSARTSDHNPNAAGVVCALDITHDPEHGFDSWKFAETLRRQQDKRIKYVISNGRIFSSSVSAWQWRPYTGPNKHAHHVHISVLGDAGHYDDVSPWAIIDAVPNSPPAPVVKPPAGITPDMRKRMMQVIMGFEGKIPPKVFTTDGGSEISGITQKDHPSQYASLKRLLDQGKTAELTAAVIAYYEIYTAPAAGWTDRAGLEFFLRDCILNRGPDGAAEILQMAMGVPIDHEVGPTTRGALAKLDVDAALAKLRLAREQYEEKKYGKQFRIDRGQWAGLVNRWNNAVTKAKEFQKEQGAIPTDVKVTVGVGILAAFVAWLSAHPVLAVGAGILLVVGLIAIAAHFFKRTD